MHECTEKDRIAVMEKEINDLSGIIKGNGGLYKSLIQLNETVKTTNENVSKLSTAVSGLLKFQTEQETRLKEGKNYSSNIKWFVGMIIALSGTIITLLILIIK